MCHGVPKGCGYRSLINGKQNLDCTQAGLEMFEIPKNADPDPKIESIFLSDNKLQSFNGSELSIYAPDIVSIDLNRNQFEKIRNDTFKALIHLQMLTITNNRIEQIESDSFNHLPKLSKLYLWGNKIQTVKDIWFRNLNALKKLDIRCNLIEHLVHPILDGQRTLRPCYYNRTLFM